jgi:hypothetical protein
MIADRRRELVKAIHDCRERGLFRSAKWAAQQLVGLPQTGSEEGTPVDAVESSSGRGGAAWELGRCYFENRVSEG